MLLEPRIRLVEVRQPIVSNPEKTCLVVDPGVVAKCRLSLVGLQVDEQRASRTFETTAPMRG
jgi:hypothetical protein